MKLFTKSVAICLAITVACFVIEVFVFQLWKANLNIPFEYKLDALFTEMQIKNLAISHQPWASVYLSAPTFQDLRDFPTTDGLSFFLIRVMFLLTKQWPVVLNTYFLLSFPLIAVIAYFVLRNLKIVPIVSVGTAILIAFLPSHLAQGETHLFLGNYFLVLPLLWICILILNNQLFVSFREKEKLNTKFLLSFMICALTGFSGIYYAFFGTYLLLLSGFLASLRYRTLSHILSSILLASLVLFGVFIGILPTLRYHTIAGINKAAVVRNPVDAVNGGLKVLNLLTPPTAHFLYKIPLIRTHSSPFTHKIDNIETMNYEGVFGIVGLLTLLLFSLTQFNKDIMLRSLSTLLFGSLLLSLMGGFGSVFAYVISDQIREYVRMGVYIAILSLVGFAYLLNIGIRKNRHLKYILVVLFIFALIDQVNGFSFPYQETIKNWNSDQAFATTLQTTLKPQAMVFQIPYKGFPETQDIERIVDYDPLRLFLHAQTLRWVYGGIKGRSHDAWYMETAKLPLNQLLFALKKNGFQGIVVDSFGYAANMSPVASISSQLHLPPQVSGDARFSFFPL